MSVTGVCSVCGAANARFVCDRCGNVVCEDHHDPETGFCSECAAEVRGGRGDRTGQGGDDDWSDTGPSDPR